ncbi:SDR family oxidoreductase [Alcanivorax sp. JB21]|uniref:SDR family oxidoreductase n=1 Tax=Alcanivorax limicola TaxID=2874102 RepID=UPI001CBE02F4|nr:SDR family oxidoreductase [Alcanivorax limicola]MBZ2190539.1 SDR family oxidoreductase [Alcanivorax limicola]
MTILVTGATGFIGRHVLAALTADHHPVLALMRCPAQLQDLRECIDALGGNGTLVRSVAGDLAAPDLGITDALAPITAVIHLGAVFAWGLDPEEARHINVDGAVAVAELAQRHNARLVMISGFMLENQAHLARLGILPDAPERTDWAQVNAQAGAYETSKIEGALRVRAFARRQQMDWVEIQPATVSGHSITGELDPAQPLFTLISNLATGRLSMIPGTPDHWLPLISVDALAATIAAATLADAVPERLLALDPDTPNLAGLLSVIAEALGRKPPKRHIPITVLRALLKVPGLPRLMNTAPESLHFLQPVRFDTTVMAHFREQQGLHWPPVVRSIVASASYWQRLAENARHKTSVRIP